MQQKAPPSYIATDLAMRDLTRSSFRHLTEQDAISDIVQKLDLTRGDEIVLITLDENIASQEWIYDRTRKVSYYTRTIVLSEEDCKIAKKFNHQKMIEPLKLHQLVRVINQRGIVDCLFGNKKRGSSPLLPNLIQNSWVHKTWKFIQDKCAFFINDSNI